jgi:hypothetical protein
VSNEDEAALPKLSEPSRRALSAAGYTRLDQLAEVSESGLRAAPHRPPAIAASREALYARGLLRNPVSEPKRSTE